MTVTRVVRVVVEKKETERDALEVDEDSEEDENSEVVVQLVVSVIPVLLEE